jgi:Family of unknown function (DUF6515)
MMTNRLLSAVPVLALVLSCAAFPVWADRNDDDGRGRKEKSQRAPEQREMQRRDAVRRDTAIKHPPGYVLDNRYRHDRYYPPRGYAVPVMPRDHRVVPYRGVKYYYHGGVWYRPSGTRFVVVLPPVGLVVPFLPPFYTTIWVSGFPYYYSAGIYYVWRPEQSAYVVTEPPAESEVSEEPATPDQLFVYPKKGQSEQQQATDRYQCHRWAADQTGFDPTRPGGNVPEAQHAAKRADYQRAMNACLEARGYSVQ